MGSKKRYKAYKKPEEDLEEIKITPDRKKEDLYINWFPGHMNKAIKQIKAKLKLVDIVLEVRDARVPLVSGNPALNAALGLKSKLIVFNKANLADQDNIKLWKEWFSKQEQPFLFINALDKGSIKKITDYSKKVVLDNFEKHNPGKVPTNKVSMMIIGLPNTGKSTLINRMSQRNAARTADKPGYTQSQQWIKVEENFLLLDTPGIMPPKIHTKEHGLWLTSVHAIPSKIVPDETTAIFLIEYLLKNKSKELLERYKLENHDMGFLECLEKIGLNRQCLLKKGVVDYERVYTIILLDFRSGELGKISFESPPELPIQTE
jgi:ribosome biogenesis GTPase A